MNDYSKSWDLLLRAIRQAADGSDSLTVYDTEHLTIDQQLQVAQIAALLSISQELSALNGGSTNV
ncbi:hypothetical protein [Phycicoccus jejuensis]|uniref:hypothetical protein n=1 Tax=Phycicoccus jejuensis TaxID=367299 RepID=UPI0004C41CCF|nr:hypothetical protein [Phycicoccus jejuensis]